MGGTLIGFLRYGRLEGRLSNGKVDLVDDDIDLIVVLPSVRRWFEFVVDFTRALTDRGWKGCAHALLWRYGNRTLRAWYPLGADLRGQAALICVHVGATSDVLLNVHWMFPVALAQGAPQAAAPCWRALRALRRAPAVRGGDCPTPVSIATQPDGYASALAPAISGELACRRSGGPCWSVSMFFAAWDDHVLPATLRHPMARCLAWGRPVPCPRESVHVLQHWQGNAYWKPSKGGARWPCLALPDAACPDPEANAELAWRERRSDEFPATARLQEEGLSHSDLRQLRRGILRLRQSGFQAHNYSGCDWSLCVRDGSG